MFGHQNRNKNDSLLLLPDGLWKVKTNYMVSKDKQRFLLFLVKMFKLLGILFIVKL